ncbi:hypothetical protein JCM6882_007241 [Rhodosporidiobolus microsporus]
MPSVLPAPVAVEPIDAVVPSLKEVKKAAIPTFPPFEYADIFDEAKYGDWRDEIVEKGYAVIPAIPEEEALKIRERAHTWLEEFGLGYKRDDPSTFKREHLPVNIKGGMYHGYGVGHSDWVWDTRTAPGVIDAFAKVYNTRDLITSFDGASIMLPGRKDVHDAGRWPHIDQNPFRYGFYCLQGIVNLNHNGPDDGGLLVLENSHKLMRKHFEETGRTETRSWGPVDWAGFEPEEEEWFFERGCKWVKVCAKPGDLILWDSRTMHMNCVPIGDVDRTNTYVCMAPAKLVSEEDRLRRIEAFEKFGGTTHVPFKDIYLRDHEPKVREETGLADPLDTGVPRNGPKKDEILLKLVGAVQY